MTAFDKLKTVRSSDRPTGEDYILNLFDNRIELHGDRRFGEDSAILSGIGTLDGVAVTYIAIDKGKDLQSRLAKNFGCPEPEGYRKSLRLMKQAEKFHRPIICFVDTLGAFCGADAEQRGQGQAIAENILEMMGIKTPVISVVIGEGGSGGALALASSDRVYMLQNSVYSVITPEGCASILWKDSGRVADAAECLNITADDMLRFKVCEKVFDEDFEKFDKMCLKIKKQLSKDIKKLSSLSEDKLVYERYMRFRKFGIFKENGQIVGI